MKKLYKKQSNLLQFKFSIRFMSVIVIVLSPNPGYI